MPQVGEKAIGTTIGNHSWGYYQYAQCPDCGYTRWVASKTCKTSNGRCNSCGQASRKGKPVLKLRGANNNAWKGGRLILQSGYIRIQMYPEDPLYQMAKKASGAILEHRLVMARHLGRCLKPWEVVHHINSDHADNRIENLELLPNQASHTSSILLQHEVNKLLKRVYELESRVIQLEAQLVVNKIGVEA